MMNTGTRKTIRGGWRLKMLWRIPFGSGNICAETLEIIQSSINIKEKYALEQHKHYV